MARSARLTVTLAAAALAVGLSSPAHAASPDSRPPSQPLAAGTPISTQDTPRTGARYWCSTGIPARKGNREFLLTADHCVSSLGQPIYSAWTTNGARTRIGTVAGVSTEHDVAAIEVADAAPRYWAGSRVRGARIASLRVGSTACQYGMRTGSTCRLTVTRIQRDADGQPVRVIARAMRGAAALPGDSGGTVADTQGRIVGIVSATSADRTWLAYTPATTALANWDMQVASR